MNITRDVVRDLLPAYLAGEASADTNRLVEAFAAKDAEIARSIREAASALPEPPARRGDAELETLRRTRRAVSMRSWLLAAAIFFSLLPASVRGGDAGVQWLALAQPRLALGFAAVALVLWTAYFVLRRQVRSAGF